MTVLSLSCVLALSASSGPHPPTNAVNFVRAYEQNEKSTYELRLRTKGGGMDADSTVEIAARRDTQASKWRITISTTKVAVSGHVTAHLDGPPQKPEPLVTTLGTNNLPQELNLTQTELLVPFVMVAGMTADKPVYVGQKIPLNWSTKGKFVVGFKGSGKIVAVDPVAQTAAVTWTFDLFVDGVNLGETVFRSVYDTSNFSLKSCNGADRKGIYIFSAIRIDKSAVGAAVAK